jgi:hypothetical protein
MPSEYGWSADEAEMQRAQNRVDVGSLASDIATRLIRC